MVGMNSGEEIRDSLSDCSSDIERNKDVLPPCMGQKNSDALVYAHSSIRMV